MQYAFAFGSLMNPDSANRTLQRPAPPTAEMRPAELAGYFRRWQVVTPVHFTGDNHPAPAIVLDIQPATGRACNGILIPIHTDDELARLDAREKRYDRIDVTHAITPLPDDAAIVYTYRGRAEHTAAPPHACITGLYLDTIDAALRLWGDAFTARYHETTLPPTFPRRDGEHHKL